MEYNINDLLEFKIRVIEYKNAHHWITGYMDDERMNGWMDKWMDGWMDKWMDGWVDGWVDG